MHCIKLNENKMELGDLIDTFWLISSIADSIHRIQTELFIRFLHKTTSMISKF